MEDAHKAKQRARSKRYRERHPDRRRDTLMRHKYGLSLREYDALIEAQHWQCAICKREAKLVVDHDHATGRVRGLLCNPCNTALGLLAENTTALGRAIRYLKEER